MTLELVLPALSTTRPCPMTAEATVLRLARAKRSYTTRRVRRHALQTLLTDPAAAPRPGDLLLARVDRLGKHVHLEGIDSRRAALFAGDEILVACGARYAPDQFDAALPESLAPCHLVAGGGVAGRVRARHGGVAAPTEITPIGLVADAAGRRVNVLDHALQAVPAGPHVDARQPRAPVLIASLGTSMNAGKTTSAAYLVRGLVRSGLRVGAAKLTGTGSGNDPGLLRDAGALSVLDFVDAGHASTCGLEPALLEHIADTLISQLAVTGVEAIVLEVADGLLQRETAALLASPHFVEQLDGVLFSSGEAMGAVAGAEWLRQRRLPVLALAGAMTRSPLARQEAAQATGLPVFGLDDLGNPSVALALWQQAGARRTPVAA